MSDSEIRKIAIEIAKILVPEISEIIEEEVKKEIDSRSEESLLTANDVMKKIGVSKTKFFSMSGGLPTITMPGGTKRYRYSDVLKYLTNYNG